MATTTRMAKLAVAFAATLVLLPVSANAVLVNYTFIGTIADEFTSLDFGLGNGPMLIPDNTSFTITGMTLTDFDTNSDSGVGMYSAMSTYNFGAGLTFTTDGLTGETFLQSGTDSPPDTSINQVGLIDPGFTGGFFVDFSNILASMASVNSGAVVLGGPIFPSPPSSVDRELLNSAGETLKLGGVTITSFTIVSKIPEPATLVIFGVGLVGLGLVRRRRRAAG